MSATERQFKTGIFSMSDKAYFAEPGVSQTDLKYFRRSPAHYKAYKAAPPEQTTAMRLGSLFDRMIFDHDDFTQSIAIKPEGFDGRTTSGKQWMAENRSRDVLTLDEHQTLCAMKVSLLAHPIARAALSQGKAQQAVFAPFAYGGQTQIKGKIDWVPPVESNCLVDLKTTTDASPDAFSRKLWDLDYHVQAAFYLDLWNSVAKEEWTDGEGIKHTGREFFVFIAVETEAPYAVSVFNLRGEAIGIGRKTYIDALAKFIDCERSGEWPAYSSEIVEIDLPTWAKGKAA